jgi:hypothetical protein
MTLRVYGHVYDDALASAGVPCSVDPAPAAGAERQPGRESDPGPPSLHDAPIGAVASGGPDRSPTRGFVATCSTARVRSRMLSLPSDTHLGISLPSEGRSPVAQQPTCSRRQRLAGGRAPGSGLSQQAAHVAGVSSAHRRKVRRLMRPLHGGWPQTRTAACWDCRLGAGLDEKPC